ncbi:MAG: HslU--HslV peptidase ATPase subunit [Spirochaetae bacterium HGW-Spirochaetae-3]|nr:MAG: HslU--HslV peptidase ATPase subunit [Spirochaetae bacterium HGW-Spirochaetae-3]
MKEDFQVFTPRRVVEELDRYIIGQNKAKRAVAIALRNRLRRKLLPEAAREEIAPKNILMIGPTGVGKTEIARRLARLCDAPFVKVEATKYTEVGYVGRDVESMIRDLMAAGYRMVMEEMAARVKDDAEKRTEERLLDLLLPGLGPKPDAPAQASTADARPDTWASPVIAPSKGNDTREKFRKMLRDGTLEDKEVEVQVSAQATPSIEMLAGQQMEDLESAFSGLANIFGGKKKKRNVAIKDARRIILEEESDRLVDKDRASAEARERVEQSGIVFIDEIDKIATREGRSGGGMDVSREGVQRDILPIVEGSKVTTKYGVVDTTHVLFIAAGAFNVSKPSDLIPELQGRFPIRVELEALSASDFVRILTEPENALVTQYTQLLSTEGVELSFSPAAVERLASVAEKANSQTENIGARRLHTIMERLLEEVSFDAPEMSGQKVGITPEFVDGRFKGVFESEDLAKFIL